MTRALPNPKLLFFFVFLKKVTENKSLSIHEELHGTNTLPCLPQLVSNRHNVIYWRYEALRVHTFS